MRRLSDRYPAALSGKALFAVVVWGVSFVATRVALRAFDPFGLVAVRLLMGTLMLVLVVKARGGVLLPARRDALRCVFLGVVLGAHLLIQAYGLTFTTAINTAWIIGFIPVMIAIGAQMLGRQRLNPTGWSGVILGVGGVLLVTLSSPPDFKQARFGDLLQMVSCLTWTVYTLAGIGPVKRNGAIPVTTVAMGVAAIVLTAATALTGSMTGPITMEILLTVGFLGLVCSGLAYYLWFQAVDELGPTRVGSILYLEPFVTLFAATLLLSEPVSGNTVLAGACVLSGVWLVSKGSR